MDFLEDMSKIIIPLVLIAGAAYVAVSSAKNHDEKHEKDDDNYMAEGISIGMCLGAALGSIFADEMAVGIGIGMMLGMAVGINIKKPKAK